MESVSVNLTKDQLHYRTFSGVFLRFAKMLFKSLKVDFKVSWLIHIILAQSLVWYRNQSFHLDWKLKQRFLYNLTLAWNVLTEALNKIIACSKDFQQSFPASCGNYTVKTNGLVPICTIYTERNFRFDKKSERDVFSINLMIYILFRLQRPFKIFLCSSRETRINQRK